MSGNPASNLGAAPVIWTQGLPHSPSAAPSKASAEQGSARKWVREWFDDPMWMTFVTDLFSIASSICSMMAQSKATEFVPYLSILSSPFYLRHAIKDSIARFKLMGSACKTSRVADAFFWGIGGVSAVGSAVSDIVKPFGGGITVLGLSTIPALHTLFAVAIPIMLIAFNTIGMTYQGWSAGKAEMALHQFKQRKELLDGSLTTMEAVLLTLQNPQRQGEGPQADAHYALDLKRFTSTHFTTDARQQLIQTKISTLLNRELTPLLEQLNEGTLFERIEKSLTLCEGMIEHRQRSGEDASDLEARKTELLAVKQELYDEGYEILQTAQSEMERRVLEVNVYLWSALITIGVGILFLTAPEQHYISGNVLSIGVSLVSVSYIIFNKSVSQENFLRFKRFIKHIEPKKVSQKSL